jgi:2-methylisocitrate lyase-like PEP mutase family enzyme
LRKAERLRKELRDQLDGKELIVAPGTHGPLYAKIVEKCGWKCVYVTGYGTAANILGVPDVGLLTSTEMTTNVSHICDAVNVPVIADMDTGYGNAINVLRTVRDYEKAGVSGFHIEDQVTPKKCGFMSGKILVSKEEMIGKIKACIDARDDPNLLVIARCDARGTIEQRDELYERCNAYAEAGADVIFPERPESFEDIELDLKNIKAPLLLNGIIPKQYGISSIEDVRKLGYAILIMPGASHRAAAESCWKYMNELRRTGRPPVQVTINLTKRTLDFDDVVGLSEIVGAEERYLPRAEIEARYGIKRPSQRPKLKNRARRFEEAPRASHKGS